MCLCFDLYSLIAAYLLIESHIYTISGTRSRTSASTRSTCGHHFGAAVACSRLCAVRPTAVCSHNQQSSENPTKHFIHIFHTLPTYNVSYRSRSAYNTVVFARPPVRVIRSFAVLLHIHTHTHPCSERACVLAGLHDCSVPILLRTQRTHQHTHFACFRTHKKKRLRARNICTHTFDAKRCAKRQATVSWSPCVVQFK